MICALCYPDEIRAGKVRAGQALATCARHFAETYWRSRQTAEPEPAALPSPLELIAQQQMLAAVCQ